MIRATLIGLLGFLSTSFAFAAEYRDGWNTQNFYEALNLCRAGVIYPAARDYEAAGLKRGRTRFDMRNEVIAKTPAFELIASQTCYCAINQYAKHYPYVDAKVRKGEFAEYMGTPECKAKMASAMDALKSDPNAHSLP